jgi:hypothetical protein
MVRDHNQRTRRRNFGEIARVNLQIDTQIVQNGLRQRPPATLPRTDVELLQLANPESRPRQTAYEYRLSRDHGGERYRFVEDHVSL